MSILIKGMEFPLKKNGAVLIIYPDGKCAYEEGKTYQAVPIPPHGRLIDADAFERGLKKFNVIVEEDLQDVIYALRDYPAIIEAEGEND